MKAVLIATDYIKTSTGEYKALEMNTNASLAPLELLFLILFKMFLEYS